MIETPHAEDARRRVPVYSLYSETREPTDAMLEGLDVLVVDLQDVGTRVYTFIYTMAYCLKAAARKGIPVIVCDRPNPIGGRTVEGPMLDARLRVVRRALPDRAAPRPDDRRTGAALQRAVRPRRAARDGRDGRLGTRRLVGLDRRAVGDAVTEHADARHGHRLPGHGAVRGHADLRGTRDDPAVRAGGPSGRDRCRDVRQRPQRAGPARRPLPAGVLRADVPEARRRHLRRVPDPRDRPRAVPVGGRGGRAAVRLP